MRIPAITISHRSFRIDLPELALEPGEVLGIFGKSGAGKTSYLHRIRTLFPPTQVHYMSQFDGLFEEITVRQNIELGLAATGKRYEDFADWETTYAALLSDFEVDRHMNKFPRAMSGGQRKRAEIVRSLIMNPEILLLDEPFLGIGHLFEAVSTREILKRGTDRSGVTIVVSHDFDLLCSFSRRVMLIDDKGVVGFIPTRDPSWKPENARTAWTLGVDNVLPADTLRSLAIENLPEPPDGTFLGFWSSSAAWNIADAPMKIRIKSDDIRSVHCALRHGKLSTRIEVKVPAHHEPAILVGTGEIDANAKEHVLGVSSAWTLTA